MYAGFFGLRELPFNNTPDPRFFFSTPEHEEALASLIYAVDARKGFVLLTGEIGAGKTLVSRLMLRHFGSRIAYATINHAVPGAIDLLESVCTEFDLRVPDAPTTTQLVRRLHDFLLAKFAEDVPVVLVLDEAQNLPEEGFEQLRMIGNLEADDAKLLQIAIVGQPELQEMFAGPRLKQLRQRIFRNFHLPALDRALTESYIRHRLLVAGATEQSIFTQTALDEIHRYSRGLPRLINALCDNAMLSAYAAERRDVDQTTIRAVAEQMMMLDGPDSPPAWADAKRITAKAPAQASSARQTKSRAPQANLGSITMRPGASSRDTSTDEEADSAPIGVVPTVAVPVPIVLAQPSSPRSETERQLVANARRELDSLKRQLALETRTAGQAGTHDVVPPARIAAASDVGWRTWLEAVQSAADRVEAASLDLLHRERDLKAISQEAARTLHALRTTVDRAGESAARDLDSNQREFREPCVFAANTMNRSDADPGGEVLTGPSTGRLRTLLERTRDSIAGLRSMDGKGHSNARTVISSAP